MHKTLKSFFTCSLFLLLGWRTGSAQLDQPNFIFIVVDDLNDYVQGITDQPQVLTPNIQELVNRGMLFSNAYANSPGCAPSRTSFLSGKDIQYTGVYNNEDYASKFRENFSVANGNEIVYSLPQILKDSAGYFTYGINKIFHNPNNNDFDKTIATPACDKTLSWNRMDFIEDSDSLLEALSVYGFGNTFDWGMIPDSLEPLLEDYIGTNLAINFIDSVATGTAETCGAPFFMALGYYRPHIERFIPEKYFPDYYLNDVYAEPFVLPYNNPVDAYPYNGIVMPVQPDLLYGDYYNLPEGGIARAMADNGGVYDQIETYVTGLDPLPVIDDLLTDEDRMNILRTATAANYEINYIAAIQYIDAQLGRLMDALEAYPAIYDNTIVVLLSDNGYSLGEKRHWTKWTLWEPDLRVPMIIADPSREGGEVVEQTVSLLDLFPTVCDFAHVNYPTFPDGSKYLDGHSIAMLLDEPNLKYEYPSLSSYKKNGGIGSCYPHHSVRNERWHYIRYRENNDGTFATGFCDSINHSYQQELYEIGIDRETDPYEWNNLAEDPDYAPVINFLEQWMPDSVYYLKKAFRVTMQHDAIDCLLDPEGSVHLSASVFDTAGILFDLPDTMQLRWYTNKSPEYTYGQVVDIDLTTIPDGAFDIDAELIIYVELIGADSNIIQGFDLQYFYADPIHAPEATYDVAYIDALTIAVTGYTLTGTYYTSWWDFGDGTTSPATDPITHVYPDEGPYTLTNFVSYGNDTCVAAFSKEISFTTDTSDPEIQLFCYPNPVDDLLRIYLPVQSAYTAVDVFDLAGRPVLSQRFITANTLLFISLDCSKLTNGMYIVSLNTDQGRYSAPVVVMHP